MKCQTHWRITYLLWYLLTWALVGFVVLPIWAVLKLTVSPHARSLYNAVGEQVAYMDEGFINHIAPRVYQGTLESIHLELDDRIGLFSLKFRLSGDNTGVIGTLDSLNFNSLQPLERANVGIYDFSSAFLIVSLLTLSNCFILYICKLKYKLGEFKQAA